MTGPLLLGSFVDIMIDREKNGFTLIELLIVITIIGVLAVALVPRVIGGPAKARDAQRKADLQQIGTALSLYADDHQGKYPTYIGPPPLSCIHSVIPAKAISDELAAYMTVVPNEPKNGNSWRGVCAAGDYSYVVTLDGFFLIAKLENSGATGEGIYMDSAIGFDPWFSGNVSTATHLTANSGELCSDPATDCEVNGAVYVFSK